MADALLAVSNIETYYGPIMALRGVSFTVPAGAIVTGNSVLLAGPLGRSLGK